MCVTRTRQFSRAYIELAAMAEATRKVNKAHHRFLARYSLLSVKIPCDSIVASSKRNIELSSSSATTIVIDWTIANVRRTVISVPVSVLDLFSPRIYLIRRIYLFLFPCTTNRGIPAAKLIFEREQFLRFDSLASRVRSTRNGRWKKR